MHSVMMVAIQARGRVLGIAVFVRTDNPDPFERDDLLLAEELVDRAALSLDNANRYTASGRRPGAAARSTPFSCVRRAGPRCGLLLSARRHGTRGGRRLVRRDSAAPGPGGTRRGRCRRARHRGGGRDGQAQDRTAHTGRHGSAACGAAEPARPHGGPSGAGEGGPRGSRRSQSGRDVSVRRLRPDRTAPRRDARGPPPTRRRRPRRTGDGPRGPRRRPHRAGGGTVRVGPHEDPGRHPDRPLHRWTGGVPVRGHRVRIHRLAAALAHPTAALHELSAKAVATVRSDPPSDDATLLLARTRPLPRLADTGSGGAGTPPRIPDAHRSQRWIVTAGIHTQATTS